jgi:5-methylcytosine-specific restriction endonuclease McrA
MMMATVTEVDRSLPASVPALLRPERLMTLELNATFEPLRTHPLSLIPATEAIIKLWKDTASVVETWKDAFGNDVLFHSPSIAMPAPKVIVLRDYVPISNDPKPTRRSFLLRDRFTCQYCGKRFSGSELTFDHLIPRSKGGKTTWENVVMACASCNSKKADRMPNLSGRKLSGLRPLKMPKKPTNAALLKAGLEFLPDQFKETWGDWLYWSVPLDE